MVALAIAPGDAVDRQHHDVDARFFCALHHSVVERPVLMEIELIDLRRVVRLAQLLQTNRAERETPNIVPNFAAAAATARSPWWWNSRCSAVGEQ